MMTKEQIKDIERKLNELAEDDKDFDGSVFNNRFRAYAQGIAFVLSKIGYSVEWDNGKATVVKDD